MAKRGKKSSQALYFWIFVISALAASVAGGYAWRSYAPLPVPGGGPLAGDPEPKEKIVVVEKKVPVEKPAKVNPADAAARQRAEAAEARAASAEKEILRLQKEVAQLRSVKSKTEEELADMQIKDVLGGG